jgi:hypothetical protein
VLRPPQHVGDRERSAGRLEEPRKLLFHERGVPARHLRRGEPDVREQVLYSNAGELSEQRPRQPKPRHSQSEEIVDGAAFIDGTHRDPVVLRLTEDVVQRVVQVALVLDRPDAGALEPAVQEEESVAGQLDSPHGFPRVGSGAAEQDVEVSVHDGETNQLCAGAVTEDGSHDVAQLGLRAGQHIVVLEAGGAVPRSGALRRRRNRAHVALDEKRGG